MLVGDFNMHPTDLGPGLVCGAPLGADEIAATRAELNWPWEPFEIPAEIAAAWDRKQAGISAEAEWQQKLTAYRREFPGLADEFERAWAHAGAMGDAGYLFSRLKPATEIDDDIGFPVRVLHTRPGDSEIFRAQRAAIQNAQNYIFIQNAYFTDDAMLYELAKARRRGVDVRVILPLVGNHGPVNKSNVLAANAMPQVARAAR